jgi:glycosyltransferase involved in cell wall biosynthesis
MSQKISVLLIAQNAEQHLARCLDSLKSFDEIIFVDGGSSDKSIEIAKKYPNVVIYENSWPGFIEQRNYSLSKASHDWCFMIDADEALGEGTAEEIYRVANNPNGKALFRIMRTEFYLGVKIESGYGRSNYQERLFLRKRILYSGGNHHEHLIDGNTTNESPELIANINSNYRVLHDETYGLTSWVKKLQRFALCVASEKIEKKGTTNIFIVLLSFPGTFLQIYLKSYRLGKVGFVVAVQTALYRCLVKLIVYEHQHIGFDTDNKTSNYLG